MPLFTNEMEAPFYGPTAFYVFMFSTYALPTA